MRKERAFDSYYRNTRAKAEAINELEWMPLHTCQLFEGKTQLALDVGDQLVGKVQYADSNELALSESTGTVSKWAFLAVISMVSKLHSRAVQVFSHLLK